MNEIRDLRNRSRAWFLRNLLLPAGDLYFQQGLMKRLKFLEKAQWWDQKRLHAHRDRLLSDLMGIAWREVAFYRELMEKSNLTSENIRKPEDLQRFPIVVKDMIRAAYPGRITRKTGQKTYEQHSSGSTGANFFVLEDPETTGWYRATVFLCLEWAGWRIGEKHVQTGMTVQRSLDRQLKDALLGCHYVPAADLSDRNLDKTLEALDHYSIQHLWGFPATLYYLALRARDRRWNRPMRSLVTWGDQLYPHYRQTIEEVFLARVYDTYGCSEGMQIAAQCGQGAGYHVHTLDVILEFVDDYGNPASRHSAANLIVTRLHAGPMPLIRYRIGDMAVRGTEDLCACGRGFELIQSIQGRATDVVITPSGNRLIVHFFTGILEHFHEIHSFQVVQKNLSSALIRVVTPDGRPLAAEAHRRIKTELQSRGMGDMEIDVEQVAEIPISPAGKRRFIISELVATQSRQARTSGTHS